MIDLAISLSRHLVIHHNALIRAFSSQSTSQASCQNFVTYTKVACDRCSEQIFVAAFLVLLVSPNILVNS